MFKAIWMWIIDNRDFLIALVALFLTILQFIISCVKNQEKYEIIADKIDFQLLFYRFRILPFLNNSQITNIHMKASHS